MSEDGTESIKQTLDLVIVNSNISEVNDGMIIRWYLSNYHLDVNFNLTIKDDELLNGAPTFEKFPQDAVIYTHLAPKNVFITLAGVHQLTEDPYFRNYRPDLRFIVAIDDTYLYKDIFLEYCKLELLFEFLENLSEHQLDPANVVSATYQHVWVNFFTCDPQNPESDHFKDYAEKLLALRAGQQKQDLTYQKPEDKVV